jgi:hypothetical protein
MTSGVEALIKTIVKAGIESREQWHEWKRSNADLLTQLLDYRHREGMPEVTQIVVPHFHPELQLIGLNYTPAAGISLHHYQDGWSDTLRQCRGVTYDRQARLVAKPFPKFFNFGEIGGEWGKGPYEVTAKEDGHLVIVFRHGDHVIAKTRGEFNSKTAILANEAIKADLAPHWLEMDLSDVTVLCELIHPETRVGVDYGDRRALIMIGMYDHVSGADLGIDELRKAADALGLEAVREVKMTREQLVGVVNGGGNNAEGFVARWQDGHRVKFKYGSYMQAMAEEKAQRRAEREKPAPIAGVSRRVVDRAVREDPSYIRRPAR